MQENYAALIFSKLEVIGFCPETEAALETVSI